MRFDDMYLSDEDLSYLDDDISAYWADQRYEDNRNAPSRSDPESHAHMLMMSRARQRALSPAQRSKIAAHAGKARRKSASVPCPRCGAESSYNGRPRRICANGHSFTERG